MKIRNNFLVLGSILGVLITPFFELTKTNNMSSIVSSNYETIEEFNTEFYQDNSKQELVVGNEEDNKFNLYWDFFGDTIDLTFLKNNNGQDIRASFKFTIKDVKTGNYYEYYDLFSGDNYYRKNLRIDDSFSYGTVKLETEYLLTLQYYQGNSMNLKTETFNVVFSEHDDPEVTIDNVITNNQTVSNVSDGNIVIDFSLNDEALNMFDKVFITLWDENFQEYILLKDILIDENQDSYSISLDNLTSGNYSVSIYGQDSSYNLISLGTINNLTINYDVLAPAEVPSFLIIDGYSTTPDSIKINLFYENNGVENKNINYSYNGISGVVETNSLKNFYNLEISGLTSETTYDVDFWFENDISTKQTISIKTDSSPFVYSPFVDLNINGVTSTSASFDFNVFDYSLLLDDEVTWTLNDITNDIEVTNSSITMVDNHSTIELSSLTSETTYELVLNSTSSMDSSVVYEKNYIFTTASLNYLTPTVSLNSTVTSNNFIEYDFSTLDISKRITGGQINVYGGFEDNNKLEIETIKEISFNYDDLINGSKGNFYLNEISSKGNEYSAYFIVFDINYLDENGVEKSLDINNLDLDLIDNKTDKLVLLSTPTSLSLTTWLEGYLSSSIETDDSLLTFSWEIFLFVIGGVVLIALTSMMLIYRSKLKKLE